MCLDESTSLRVVDPEVRAVRPCHPQPQPRARQVRHVASFVHAPILPLGLNLKGALDLRRVSVDDGYGGARGCVEDPRAADGQAGDGRGPDLQDGGAVRLPLSTRSYTRRI